MIALFAGWRMDRRMALADSDFAGSRIGRAWIWLLRLVTPALILTIFFGSVAGH